MSWSKSPYSCDDALCQNNLWSKLLAKAAFSKKGFSGPSGFSYIEVLVTTALIAACLVPLLQALAPSLFSIGEQQNYIDDYHALRSRLEEILAEPYANLEASAIAAGSGSIPSSYSDAAPVPLSNGRQVLRQVYLSQYDGNGDGTPDNNLLLVKVELDKTSQNLQTLTSP